MMQDVKRAVSVNELLRSNIRCLDFDGDWERSFGKPERTGTWLIWGNSGNGKTRFALQLAKYMARLGQKVAVNSLEEGASLSMKNAFEQLNMQEVSRQVILLDKEPLADMIHRLMRRKSPDVIIIDSLQYTGLSYADYKHLRDKFRNKLFVFISHADGNHPAGRVARSVRFDAFVKIYVQNYIAYPVSRYGGGEPFTIWEKE